jgi:hypothetical protein
VNPQKATIVILATLFASLALNFHKAYLAGIAIIAIVLFAVVWRRFK